MKIVYIVQRFPTLTETFIYREIQALRDKGFTILPAASRRPAREELSVGAVPFLAETIYIYPLSFLKIIWAHIYFLFSQPGRYVTVIGMALSRDPMTVRGRLRTLAHIMGGVYLAHQMKHRQPDHVHAHFINNAATIGLVMSRLLDIPFSLTVHNNVFTDRLLVRQKLQYASHIVCISEFSRDFLLNLEPDFEQYRFKCRIIRCGIPLAEFPSPPARLMSTPPVILAASQLQERKGFGVLIHACHRLVERGLAFTCVIAGDGSMLSYLQSQVAEFGLESTVTFHGRYVQEDLQTLFYSADLFVLPSLITSTGDSDGIPVVLMEAMALGSPVISTSVSGIPELIEHGHNGLLVPPGSVESLADAIQLVISMSATDRERLSRNARQTIETEYDIIITSHKLAELFAYGKHA